MLCDNLEGEGVGGRLNREGTYVHLRLFHTVIRQKPTQLCRAIILHLKTKIKKKYIRISSNEMDETGAHYTE